MAAPQDQQPQGTTYSVAVKTSNVQGAGTDAEVRVQLIGANGRGPQLHLKDSINHRDKFEAGHTDVFFFPGQQPLGDLSHMRIWHDSTSHKPNWHLECVEVPDMIGGQAYTFVCKQWLSKTYGDRQIERKRAKTPKHLRPDGLPNMPGQPGMPPVAP
jgi:hypothetical protein